MHLRRKELQLTIFLGFVAAVLGQRIQPPVVTGPPNCFRAVDLCFILDGSGTIGQNNWGRILRFVLDIVQSLDISSNAARIGVSHFADNVYLDVALNDYRDYNDLQNKINSIRYVNGRTRTSRALVHTATQCFQTRNDRSGVLNLAIFISDGRPNPLDEVELRTAIARLHSVTDVVLTVGIGDEIDDLTLVRIAETDNAQPPMPGTHYFPNSNIQSLISLLPQVVRQICEPIRPPPIMQRRCTERLDVCVVLDRSGTVSPGGWGLAQQIARGLINEMLLLPEFVHLTVISFAADAQVHSRLGDNSDNIQLVNMINMLNWIGGSSALGRALNFASSNCFPFGRDRSDANNVVLLFTSGTSNENPIFRSLETGIQALHAVAQKVTVIGIENRDARLLANLAKRLSNSGPPQSGEDYFPSTTVTNIPGIVSSVISSTCRTLPQCRRPVDLCFVLDSSESVQSSGWEIVKQFVLDIVARLNIEPTQANVGVVVFSTTARLAIQMQQGQDLRQLTDAIRALPHINEQTATGEALRLAARACFPRNRRQDPNNPLVIIPKVALILTDGIPTIPSDTPGAAQRDLEAGIAVLKSTADVIGAIGVGSEIQEETLRRIAKALEPGTDPQLGTNYFRTPNFQGLNNLLDLVIPEICAEGPTIRECDKMLDVCFILDSSSSVTFEGWVKARMIVKRLSESLTNTPGTRIGVVTFSRVSTVPIRLGQFPRKIDLMNRIDQLQYLNGWTNTSGALRTAARHCFSPTNNRASRPHVALVITDGQPNIEDLALPDAIRELKDRSDLIVGIGASNDIREKTLEDLSKTWTGQTPVSGQDYFQCRDINEVDMVLGKVIDLVCADQRPSPTCRQTADICFMIDRSGSETRGGYQMIQATAISLMNSILQNLQDPPNIGIISFSDFADNNVPLGRYDAAYLQNRIGTIGWADGYTDIANTLNLTAYQCFNSPGDRPGVRNVAIFIGDGVSTLQFDRLNASTRNLKRVAHCVLAIGIGPEIHDMALFNISKRPDEEGGGDPVPGEDYFRERDNRDIPFITQRVIKKLCPGSRPPQPPQDTCRQTADFCFMIDSSGSERMFGWTQIQNTARRLIGILDDTLQAQGEKAHFGVLSFSDFASNNIPLAPHNKNFLQNRIDRITFKDGYTDIASTLNLAATQCFNSANDRRGVKNVAIFLSDGVSTLNFHLLYPATIIFKSNTNISMGIGIGIETNETSIQNITKRQDGGPLVLNRDYFIFRNQLSIDVQAIADQIIRKICPQRNIQRLPSQPVPPPGVSPPFQPPAPAPAPGPPSRPSVPAPAPAPQSYTCNRAVDLCVVVANNVLRMGQQNILDFLQNTMNAFMSPIVGGQGTFGLVSFGQSNFARIYYERTSQRGINFMQDTQNARNMVSEFISVRFGLEGAMQCFNPNRQAPNALIFITGGGRDVTQPQQRQSLIRALKSRTNIIVPIGIGGQSEFSQLFLELEQNYLNTRPVMQQDYYVFATYRDLLSWTNFILPRICPPL